MSELVSIINLDFLFRIFISAICGAMIGYERKNRHKEAGVRTHAIVALGSTLIIIISKYGFYDVVRYDAARVAAQVVSGIGFLGAGVIFVKNNVVSGLTTAAGLWTTAAVGMSVGAGLYFVGVMTAVMVILIQILLRNDHFENESYHQEILTLRLKKDPEAMERLKDSLLNYEAEILEMEVNKNFDGHMKVKLRLSIPEHFNSGDILMMLENMDDVLWSE